MAAISLYQTNLVGGSSLHPAVQLACKHSLKSLPIPMLMKHYGTISGHVFFDPESSMKYSSYKSGVAGAEVLLDGKRTVLTDAFCY